MIIKFYNIPGISTDNEPYFRSVAERINNLANYLVKSLTTYFYPVQYENRIKLEVTDVPFTLVYNYISIEMYGKDWFYFVDGYRYVNEKVYYVNLFIDAIQTFFFDTYFIRYEGKRSLEFTGLRDNLSLDPTLYLHSLTDFDEDSPNILVIQFKDASSQDFVLKKPGTVVPQTYQVADIEPNRISYDNGTRFISDGLKTFYVLVPKVGLSFMHVSYFDGSARQVYRYSAQEFVNVMKIIVNEPNIVNAYVTHVIPDGIEYKEFVHNGNTITGFYLSDKMILHDAGIVQPSANQSSQDKIFITIKEQLLGSFTTPQRAICDTNYTQISIGEVNDYVIVPIELLEPEHSYDVYCMLDICSGVRTYWINAQPLLDMKFRHVCNSIETLQIFNDMYNTYLLQNKGSLTTGVALQKTLSWVNFGNQIFNQNAAKAFSGAMSGGVAGGIVAGAEATVTSGVDLFSTLYTIDKSIQAEKENAYYTPDTVKLGNNYTSDLMNGFLHRIILETRVADYQDIIELRKYIGYLSHDVITDKTLLTLLSHYNWTYDKKLLMGSASLNLFTFNTRDNIVAIKDRLEKGVRFYYNIADLGK